MAVVAETAFAPGIADLSVRRVPAMTETVAPITTGEESTAVPTDREWPAISVIMPVLNEARHLAESVGQILAQQYPGEVELVIALGPSRDGTDEVARDLAAADPQI